jgi:hypothetical protein
MIGIFRAFWESGRSIGKQVILRMQKWQGNQSHLFMKISTHHSEPAKGLKKLGGISNIRSFDRTGFTSNWAKI